MNMKRHLWFSFLIGLIILSSAALPGCDHQSNSDGIFPEDVPKSGGNAPVISNLQYSPTEALQGSEGGSAAVTCTIDYADEEGDLTTYTVEIYDSGGTLIAS
ncbi:MAG: hypothetical protein ACOX3E_00590 [Desulfomonilia bacterium]|jgi:hypothetical protein|uniref:Uncharacterized protein n=1 Tax=anaerobic digester metagenome TaxID=1263854 RepID=A0A485M496_9ZZZZ|nr:hypothetical protein [Deltaproteobacteria bacterium]HPD22677.1 hypothetical protein [Deltaproteobacteria bacterium]